MTDQPEPMTEERLKSTLTMLQRLEVHYDAIGWPTDIAQLHESAEELYHEVRRLCKQNVEKNKLLLKQGEQTARDVKAIARLESKIVKLQDELYTVSESLKDTWDRFDKGETTIARLEAEAAAMRIWLEGERQLQQELLDESHKLHPLRRSIQKRRVDDIQKALDGTAGKEYLEWGIGILKGFRDRGRDCFPVPPKWLEDICDA